MRGQAELFLFLSRRTLSGCRRAVPNSRPAGRPPDRRAASASARHRRRHRLPVGNAALIDWRKKPRAKCYLIPGSTEVLYARSWLLRLASRSWNRRRLTRPTSPLASTARLRKKRLRVSVALYARYLPTRRHSCAEIVLENAREDRAQRSRIGCLVRGMGKGGRVRQAAGGQGHVPGGSCSHRQLARPAGDRAQPGAPGNTGDLRARWFCTHLPMHRHAAQMIAMRGSIASPWHGMVQPEIAARHPCRASPLLCHASHVVLLDGGPTDIEIGWSPRFRRRVYLRNACDQCKRVSIGTKRARRRGAARSLTRGRRRCYGDGGLRADASGECGHSVGTDPLRGGNSRVHAPLIAPCAHRGLRENAASPSRRVAARRDMRQGRPIPLSWGAARAPGLMA